MINILFASFNNVNLKFNYYNSIIRRWDDRKFKITIILTIIIGNFPELNCIVYANHVRVQMGYKVADRAQDVISYPTVTLET